MKFLRERAAEEEESQPEPVATSCSDTVNFPDIYTMKSSKSLVLASRDLNHVPDNIFEDAVKAGVHMVDLSSNKLTSVPRG